MKKFSMIILAAALIFPFGTMSQEGNVKTVSGQQNQRNMPMHEKVIIEGSTLGDLGTSGGNSGDYMVYDETGIYLEPGWEKGYAVLKDKTLLDGIMVRYDLYNQQMQFVRDEDTLAFSKPDELDYLYIGTRKFIYSEYISEGIVKKGFFEVLHEGECPLYLQRSVKYHLDPESDIDLKNDVYVRECGYFVKKSGEMAQPIKMNRKSILCAFKDKEEEVARFMDDNDLDGKTCDELKLVIAFYSSLP